MTESCLNCQHLPSPEPVRLVRQMVASGPPQAFNIIVDTPEAREEVVNFLGANSYSVYGRQQGGLWYLRATPLLANSTELSTNTQSHIMQQKEQRRILIILTSDKFGSGDDAFGTRLMHQFVISLKEFGLNLWRIILVNSAVKLAVYSSPVLRNLQEYEDTGTSIILCKECVYHYALQNSTGTGAIAEPDLVNSVQMADSVLRF